MNELLKRAKENNKRRIYTDEEIEIAVAYIRGEISATSIAEILSKNNDTAVRSKVITVLKQAFLQGKLKLDLT